MDFTHPAFRFHAERIIRKVVERYADHPAVIGYQVDHEPGLPVAKAVRRRAHAERGVGAGLLVVPAVGLG